MDLVSILEQFPTQEDCIARREKVRWGDKPICPYCNSDMATTDKYQR